MPSWLLALLKLIAAEAPALSPFVPIPFAGTALAAVGALANVAVKAVEADAASLEEAKAAAVKAIDEFTAAAAALPAALAANDAVADAEAKK